MKFSVYITCPSVLSLKNLKLHKKIGSERHIYTRKLMLWLTFNPALALTGFRTTRPWRIYMYGAQNVIVSVNACILSELCTLNNWLVFV